MNGKAVLVDLPRVLKEHLDAQNVGDRDKFMAAFASDALVNDAQREFYGVDSIRAWADREIFGARVTIEIEQVREHYNTIILRCRVDGTFDKSQLPNPLILRYYFTVTKGKISQVIIIRDKPVEVPPGNRKSSVHQL